MSALTGAFTGSVQGTLAGSPAFPGAIRTGQFTVDTTGAGRYFSDASMIVVSNDFFIGNTSPTAFDLSGSIDQSFPQRRWRNIGRPRCTATFKAPTVMLVLWFAAIRVNSLILVRPNAVQDVFGNDFSARRNCFSARKSDIGGSDEIGIEGSAA